MIVAVMIVIILIIKIINNENNNYYNNNNSDNSLFDVVFMGTEFHCFFINNIFYLISRTTGLKSLHNSIFLLFFVLLFIF
jgi:hypothetical protein